MIEIPNEAVVIIATGCVTVVSSVIAQIGVSLTESRKASREHARELQNKEQDRIQAEREVKSLKLGELWSAIELARIRLADANLQSRTSSSFPPPVLEQASKPTSDAYGISLLHFPELRPFAYGLHAATAELENELWFGGSDDQIDALLDKVTDARTSLADAIEKAASSLAVTAKQ
ncbi:hypothetical protein N7367_05395 [Stenotrophomonas sp. GD04145]|uniref:hypothetical protein n=1 Tax=Stenotrophomonas sp. GD04145 TaxID=2975436 RepID=UPI00244A3E55|nr:hypothetical protein [Stenotrophomonas sp. GD04145]MDH0170880.1 hypothetical protein [Stenotrophomonas sp. GD04145]